MKYSWVFVGLMFVQVMWVEVYCYQGQQIGQIIVVDQCGQVVDVVLFVYFGEVGYQLQQVQQYCYYCCVGQVQFCYIVYLVWLWLVYLGFVQLVLEQVKVQVIGQCVGDVQGQVQVGLFVQCYLDFLCFQCFWYYYLVQYCQQCEIEDYVGCQGDYVGMYWGVCVLLGVECWQYYFEQGECWQGQVQFVY